MTATRGSVNAGVGHVRRYAFLSFLQWLPIGLTIVPMVLLLLERGFTLAEVAAIGAVAAITVGVLELPTGGLADVVGRRPVLVGSALASAAGLLLFGLTDSLPTLVLAAMLQGLARALSTGPLEAWYVDAARAGRAVEDDAHLTTGLARGELAASLALGLGTLVSGALPMLIRSFDLPVSTLAVPLLMGAGVELVRVAVTLRLPDVPRDQAPHIPSPSSVVKTVTSGLMIAGRDRIILRVLLVAATVGVALAVIELVTPAWLNQLTADSERAALIYAILATTGFGADALGALLAPAAQRRFATPARASAIGTVLSLLAVLGLAAGSLLSDNQALLVAAVAYTIFFIGLGVAGPPLGELLHNRVRSEERATVLSAQSLVLQLAGAAGALVAGALTNLRGAWAGFAVAVIALSMGAHVLSAMARLARVPT